MDSAPSARSEADARTAEGRMIRKAKRGDQAAMREIIDSHKDRLFAFVSRTVRSHQDAEDICQDAFLKAFRSLDTFDPQYRFSTWLFTIAYRLCLNVLRRHKGVAGEGDLAFEAAPTASPEHSTAQSEEARRLQDLVWGAVDQLNTAQRATVLLFYRQNLACADIAGVLQLPVATVKSHLHRARAKLKSILEPAFSEDFSRLRILADLAG